MIKVLLIDDHKLVCEGLSMMLKDNTEISVVGLCTDSQSALGMVRELQPDLAITDISMPGIDGITLTHQIVLEYPKTKVLILTMYKKSQYIKEAVDAGASGFLTKDTEYDEFISAIKTVHRGEFYLHPSIASMALKELASSLKKDSDNLSDRERDIVRIVAQGNNVAEAAKMLVISPRTAQTHLYNAMKKLGLHNQRELIFYSIKEGIVPPEQYS